MDLEHENRRLRRQLRELTGEARNSEAVSRRCHERDLLLLTAETLPALLNILTEGMQQSFRVSCLSLVLTDPDHEIRHLLRNAGTPAEAFALVQFEDDLESLSPIYARLRKPWLGPFTGEEHARLFSGGTPLGSLALLPMMRRGALVGSLNLGSQAPQRFTRHHGSDFLYRLATIATMCLENATNRERLFISGLTDTLTGLHNRRYLERRLKEELARASRYRLPLSCLFLDADHFKRVNDTQGHAVGDQVLVEMAQRVKACLRASDIATRYGGEEFALILPQTDADEAAHLAERIRLEISATPIAIVDGGQPLNITVSVGVSRVLPSAHDRDLQALGQRLLAEADAALYQAKERGRNRVVRHPANQGEQNASCLSKNVG
jgi:diguanylate cyclase (GGDEF)-like protein